MLSTPRFREIGTVSGWEKLQIHAKEDISGREKERKREQDTASLRSDFDSISDTRYIFAMYISRDARRVGEGRGWSSFSNGFIKRWLAVSQNICKITIN